MYLGVQLHERLTYSIHVPIKRAELNLRFHRIYRLLATHSSFYLFSRRLLYMVACRLIWSYSLLIFDCTTTPRFSKQSFTKHYRSFLVCSERRTVCRLLSSHCRWAFCHLISPSWTWTFQLLRSGTTRLLILNLSLISTSFRRHSVVNAFLLLSLYPHCSWRSLIASSDCERSSPSYIFFYFSL